jgi:hypothetical protein
MSKDQNTYAKRARETEKKRKAEAKRERRRKRKEDGPVDSVVDADAGDTDEETTGDESQEVNE